MWIKITKTTGIGDAEFGCNTARKNAATQLLIDARNSAIEGPEKLVATIMRLAERSSLQMYKWCHTLLSSVFMVKPKEIPTDRKS